MDLLPVVDDTVTISYVCYVCGIPSTSDWCRKVSLCPTADGSPFYPDLHTIRHTSIPVHVDEYGRVNLCPFCHALLKTQWDFYEDQRVIPPRSRGYSVNRFICAVCGIKTYRKQVRALSLKTFPFLREKRTRGSLLLSYHSKNDPQFTVVCLNCSETLWMQSEEYDGWGLSVQKREYNWIRRPAPPETSAESVLVHSSSGKMQFPQYLSVEPVSVPYDTMYGTVDHHHKTTCFQNSPQMPPPTGINTHQDSHGIQTSVISYAPRTTAYPPCPTPQSAQSTPNQFGSSTVTTNGMFCDAESNAPAKNQSAEDTASSSEIEIVYERIACKEQTPEPASSRHPTDKEKPSSLLSRPVQLFAGVPCSKDNLGISDKDNWSRTLNLPHFKKAFSEKPHRKNKRVSVPGKRKEIKNPGKLFSLVEGTKAVDVISQDYVGKSKEVSTTENIRRSQQVEMNVVATTTGVNGREEAIINPFLYWAHLKNAARVLLEQLGTMSLNQATADNLVRGLYRHFTWDTYGIYGIEERYYATQQAISEEMQNVNLKWG